MQAKMTRNDVLGLVKPAVDAHTLGLTTIQNLLTRCGMQVCLAGSDVCAAVGEPRHPESPFILGNWLVKNRITHLGFSYRLDPVEAANLFFRLVNVLQDQRLLHDFGGLIRDLFFAGLPEACSRVTSSHPGVGVFCGDETAGETLDKLGVALALRPSEIVCETGYDQMRLDFADDLIAKEKYGDIPPGNQNAYPEFGTRKDSLVARLNHRKKQGGTPIIRAHAGPYCENRNEALRTFSEWARELAKTKFLDVLSIGTSQLTQSDFGMDWGQRPNGGGVPVNSPEEYSAIYDASRPLLLRTYAGTRNIAQLARMHEETINIAWHALSFWWFCELDGRGPYGLRQNLEQHIAAVRFSAETGKPFEPNTSHHFAFRGADDVTCVVSAYLAAKMAKRNGIRHLVQQNMLNTPKYLSGINDLARSRAALTLIRELEDADFKVILQPRAGLDYLSHDPVKARVQLAAATALMDDIEADDIASPPMIHVVGHTEATRLADPAVINESIRITLAALKDYRALRRKGDIPNMGDHEGVGSRMEHLLADSRQVIDAIERTVKDPYSATGFYDIFRAGFLPTPYLWHCRDQYPNAVRWQTGVVAGAVRIVNESGSVVTHDLVTNMAKEAYLSRPDR